MGVNVSRAVSAKAIPQAASGPGGGRQKAFTIYAWNEFGEGGIVAPTRGDGYMKLESIGTVFGREPR